MGKSPALESVLEKVRLVGPSKATVLLTGETAQERSYLLNPFIKTVIVLVHLLSQFIVQLYRLIY